MKFLTTLSWLHTILTRPHNNYCSETQYSSRVWVLERLGHPPALVTCSTSSMQGRPWDWATSCSTGSAAATSNNSDFDTKCSPRYSVWARENVYRYVRVWRGPTLHHHLMMSYLREYSLLLGPLLIGDLLWDMLQPILKHLWKRKKQHLYMIKTLNSKNIISVWTMGCFYTGLILCNSIWSSDTLFDVLKGRSLHNELYLEVWLGSQPVIIQNFPWPCDHTASDPVNLVKFVTVWLSVVYRETW